MAPSKESAALKQLFQVLGSQFPAEGDPALSRAVYDQVHQAAAECEDVTYKDTTYGGRPGLLCKPAGCSTKHLMLYFHGGAYCFGSPNSHRKLAAHLAAASNCMCISVDYRQTPEHPFPAPQNDCVDVYKDILDQGVLPGNIVFCGDSCGGNLATTVVIAAMKQGLPVPGAVVALSPEYDKTCSGATMITNAEVDVLQTKDSCLANNNRYLQGNIDPKDALVSPVFADESVLRRLPPHWLSVCGYDMLRSDGETMASLLKSVEVEVVLEVHEEQQHVMEFMAGKAPEATESIRRIGAWVRNKVGSREQ